MSGPATEWILTWLWQGSVLALLATAAIRFIPRTDGATRHLVWWVTLVGVVVLAIAPWGWTLAVTGSTASVPTATGASSPASATPSLWAVQVPVMPGWGFGVGIALWGLFSTRRLRALGVSLRHLRAIKRGCVSLEPGIQSRLPLWMSVRETRGREVRLCVSNDLATASMLGLGAPIIALPTTLVSRLPFRDLDQIVLHEYSHAQRRDDWATLVQATVETLWGWHPAIWWIGRNLRLEREVACDEWVVRRTSCPTAYAACLTRVAALALEGQAVPLASRAVRARHELSGRVERLLGSRPQQTHRSIGVAGALGTVMVAVMSLTLMPPTVSSRPSGVGQLQAPLSASALARVRLDEPLAVAPRHPIARSGQADALGAAASTEPAIVAPVPENVNQATLLDGIELRPGSVVVAPVLSRSGMVSRRARSVLVSHELAVDPKIVVSMISPNDLERQDIRSDVGPSPWGRVAEAGRAVGVGSSEAGLATAVAFRTLGSSLARAFRGGR